MNLEERIQNYRMTIEAQKLLQDTRVLLICSVFGGGKNTVITELLKTNKFHWVISHTTRKPRINHGVLETEGHDYHFVTLEKAEELIDQQAFIEVKYVHGNVYGTSVAEVEAAHDAGKVAIMDIDTQGVVEYLEVKPDAHAVFLLPPSVDTWLKRLETRYGNLADHEEEVTKRFRTAYDEIKHIQADKRFTLVVNDELTSTASRVSGILDNTVSGTSEYAEAVTDYLLKFLETKI